MKKTVQEQAIQELANLIKSFDEKTTMIKYNLPTEAEQVNDMRYQLFDILKQNGYQLGDTPNNYRIKKIK